MPKNKSSLLKMKEFDGDHESDKNFLKRWQQLVQFELHKVFSVTFPKAKLFYFVTVELLRKRTRIRKRTRLRAEENRIRRKRTSERWRSVNFLVSLLVVVKGQNLKTSACFISVTLRHGLSFYKFNSVLLEVNDFLKNLQQNYKNMWFQHLISAIVELPRFLSKVAETFRQHSKLSNWTWKSELSEPSYMNVLSFFWSTKK